MYNSVHKLLPSFSFWPGKGNSPSITTTYIPLGFSSPRHLYLGNPHHLRQYGPEAHVFLSLFLPGLRSKNQNILLPEIFSARARRATRTSKSVRGKDYRYNTKKKKKKKLSFKTKWTVVENQDCSNVAYAFRFPFLSSTISVQVHTYCTNT